MEFYGIEMKGEFYLDILDTLPEFEEEKHEGRLIYVEDTQLFYYGGKTEWKIPGLNIVATLSETIAGTNDLKYISPFKLAQIKATGSDLITGTDNVKYATSLSLRGLKASIEESKEGVNDIKYVTPAGLSGWATENPGVIPGTIMFYTKDTPPVGYLKANGAAISRTTYSNLFDIIGTTFGSGDGSTTFNVPDLRGEFIRGWDDTRGVDTGRVFGTLQMDDFKSHRHYLRGNDRGNNSPQKSAPGLWYDDAERRASDLNSIELEGGTETRPRNVALLACIKY